MMLALSGSSYSYTDGADAVEELVCGGVVVCFPFEVTVCNGYCSERSRCKFFVHAKYLVYDTAVTN